MKKPQLALSLIMCMVLLCAAIVAVQAGSDNSMLHSEEASAPMLISEGAGHDPDHENCGCHDKEHHDCSQQCEGEQCEKCDHGDSHHDGDHHQCAEGSCDHH